MFTDQELISGIKKNDNKILRSLYKREFVAIKKMVFTFNNISLEAEDVFQEGLARLIMNVQSDRFRGDSSLSTYLNSICRNICLKKISKNKTVPLEVERANEAVEEDNYYELLDFISRLKQQLEENCRKIIDLRFRQSAGKLPVRSTNKLPGFDEIARQLNITVSNARQRFKRCLDQLKKKVVAHPEYQTIME